MRSKGEHIRFSYFPRRALHSPLIPAADVPWFPFFLLAHSYSEYFWFLRSPFHRAALPNKMSDSAASFVRSWCEWVFWAMVLMCPWVSSLGGSSKGRDAWLRWEHCTDSHYANFGPLVNLIGHKMITNINKSCEKNKHFFYTKGNSCAAKDVTQIIANYI